MSKVQELKAKLIRAEYVQAIREKQIAEAQKRLDAIIARSTMGKTMVRLGKELAEAEERAFNLEQDLRVAAFTFHTESGGKDKRPAIGVEIQDTEKVEIILMDKALAYGKLHSPDLLVTKPKNISSFKAWLKRQMEADRTVNSFLRVAKGYKVVLKKKLWAEEREVLAEESPAELVLAAYPGVVAFINDRASCAEFDREKQASFPKTPGDYLAWIEDEWAEQEHRISHLRERSDREHDDTIKAIIVFRDLLKEVSRRLHALGVEPTLLPWETAEIVEPNPE